MSVDISHTYIGDLRVDLVAPDGSAVTLHYHQGRSMHDLVRAYSVIELPQLVALEGKSVTGVWQLRVVNTWVLDAGEFRSWRLAAKMVA